MANIEELKKLADAEGIELTEEMLDSVAGGYLPPNWNDMTPDERNAFLLASIRARMMAQHCIIDD